MAFELKYLQKKMSWPAYKRVPNLSFSQRFSFDNPSSVRKGYGMGVAFILLFY